MTFAVYFAGLVLFLLLCGYATGQDPCQAGNYKELNDVHRSTAFIPVSPFQLLCDIRLAPGWYRFTSGAGGQLPTTCQSRQRCGTLVPLWMKGTHPSVAEGIVTREVCGDYTSADVGGEPCCDDSFSISVKNCGQFYVYNLKPTTTCPAAYCAGERAPCPVGKWSSSGFPPCKDAYPLIKTPPTLSGPHIRNKKTFNFVCKINYDQNDPDQRFEVSWTFDGVISANVPSVIVADPVREAPLLGSALIGHIDKSIGCTVRAYYKDNENRKSDPLTSNTYFAGIQVIPSNLEVDERDLDRTITLKSTLPILCEFDTECCLYNVLDMQDTTDMVAVNNGFCSYKLCSANWDDNTKSATIEIHVQAKQDLITDGTHRVALTFRKILPAGGGPYLDIFAGHKSQIQVDVKDQLSCTCHITGDPHITSCDGGYYHLYKTGDFTAVQVLDKDFAIQIRNWACGTVTCVCGVVIRERNDIIIINQCNQPYGGAHTSPTVQSLYPLSEGTVVHRSTNGRSIGVYLPSGAEVRIDVANTHFNVFITIPGLYRGLTRGICGTNDGFKENDFTYPNGRQDPYVYNSHPNNFLLSWKVQGATSLFETNPAKIAVTDNVKYCKCTINAAGGEIVDCSVRGNARPTGMACQGNCPQVQVPQVINIRPLRKRSVDVNSNTPSGDDEDTPDPNFVFKEVEDINPNKQWPNAKGITQQQALSMCRDAVFKSPLNATCSTKNEMVQAAIDSCMGDILFGGITDMVEDITYAFTVNCQMDLAQDPANYKKDEKGEMIMKSEYFKDICDPQCQVHGRCGAGGQCVCNPGWEGDTCNMESGKGPQLDEIRSGSICDKSTRPCQKFYIDVTNINFVERLVCKAQTVDEKNTAVGEPQVAKAEFLSAFRLACAVPQTVTSSQRYSISASNNGILYGNALPLHVFDSTCLQCDENGCQEKKTACHIGNICYRNDVRNKNDNTQICDISKSTTAWSKVPKNKAYKISSTGLITVSLGILAALKSRV